MLKNNETSLILDKNMSISEELLEYLTYILELNPKNINEIVRIFNDYTSRIEME